MSSTILEKMQKYVGVLRELQKYSSRFKKRYDQVDLELPDDILISEKWYNSKHPDLYFSKQF